ncbi:unnamed protein product [Amoebophrya sp. A120]|nr:unnamed protein product [Amoebophrya sp. A120]|eukprot:GSA120T00001516001.1
MAAGGPASASEAAALLKKTGSTLDEFRSGGVSLDWFEEVLGADFEYSLEQEYQDADPEGSDALSFDQVQDNLVGKIGGLVAEAIPAACVVAGSRSSSSSSSSTSSFPANKTVEEDTESEFRKYTLSTFKNGMSAEEFTTFGKYIAFRRHLQAIVTEGMHAATAEATASEAEPPPAEEAAAAGAASSAPPPDEIGSGPQMIPSGSDVEVQQIQSSKNSEVAREEVAESEANHLVSSAVGSLLATTESSGKASSGGSKMAGVHARKKTSSKPVAQGGGSSGSTAPRPAKPAKKEVYTPPKPKVTTRKGPSNASPQKLVPFRTGPMPLPRPKVDTDAKISYPKLRPDSRFTTMKGNLRGTSRTLSPRRIPSVLDKREAITMFLWLEEDVKNIYKFREKIGNGIPIWLDYTLYGDDFAQKVEKAFMDMDTEGDGILPVFVLQEIVKNLCAYLPGDGGTQLDIKPVIHHFKNIFPPAKNLSLEDFIEACKFLVVRSWLADQMGGDGQGTFAPSPKVKLPSIQAHTGSAFFDGIKFPKWEDNDTDLVTKLKNEVSWLHAQLAEQRKLEYKTFSSNNDKLNRQANPGKRSPKQRLNTNTYTEEHISLQFGEESRKALHENFDHISSKINITSDSAQKPTSINNGAVQAVKTLAVQVNHKKPSDYFHIPMADYTKEDLLMEIRHLQLDVEFYKAKATSSDRKELFAEHAEQKMRIRSMQNRIRYLENQLQHKDVELEHSQSVMHGSSTWSTNVSAMLPSSILPGSSSSTVFDPAAAHKKHQQKANERVLKLAQEALQKERSKRKFVERRLAEERDSVARLSHQAKVADMEVQKMARAMAKTMGY